jgi:hypothetical protein
MSKPQPTWKRFAAKPLPGTLLSGARVLTMLVPLNFR